VPIYPEAGDGTIFAHEATWAEVHAASTGYSLNIDSNNRYCGVFYDATPYYYIARYGLTFDLSAISGTVSAVSFYLYPESSNTTPNSDMKVFGYSGANPVTVDDFGSFGDTAYTDTVADGDTWAYDDYFEFAFNETGIAAVQSALGGNFGVGGREYTHDGVGTTPGTTTYIMGYYQSYNTETSKDPYLEVTYTPLADSAPKIPHAGRRLGPLILNHQKIFI